MNEFLITLDVDWAPDFIVESIASQLIARQVRATWFITHQSAALASLRAHQDLFELGIHPNFLVGSTHGSTPADVLSHLKSIVPEAISTRSHAVVQSASILDAITKASLRVDSTIYLPEMPHIRAVKQLGAGGKLLRVPFYWADDYEMHKSSSDWSLAPYVAVEGLKIFLFHPIHLFLNSWDVSVYAALKQRVPQLSLLTEDIAQEYVNTGKGTRTLFCELLDYLAGIGNSRCLRDIHADWKREESVS